MNKKKVGDIGENVAVKILKERGLKIVEKNFHSRYGEIDIITKKSNIYYFFEVRLRTRSDYGGAIGSINKFKLMKIISTIKVWQMKNNIDSSQIGGVYGIMIDRCKKSNANIFIKELDNWFKCDIIVLQ